MKETSKQTYENMDETEKSKLTSQRSERQIMKYRINDEYRETQLEHSKRQREDPAWSLKGKPKIIQGFKPGQFRKWDNPTPKLKSIGNLKLSAKEGLWCPYCGALYFLDEVNDKGQYTTCCQNGTFKNHLLIDETIPKEILLCIVQKQNGNKSYQSSSNRTSSR